MKELTFRNNVERYIGNNLDVLEDILNKAAKEYVDLKNQSTLDFGKELTPERLVALFPEVTAKVRDLLDVSDALPAYFTVFNLRRDLKRGAYVGLGTFTIAAITESFNGLTTTDLEKAGLLAFAFGFGGVLYNMREHLGSAFDPQEKVIRIGEKKTVPAVGGIAHEYTHHLQNAFTDLAGLKRNPVVEGHARGVEYMITKSFAQESGNPAVVFDAVDRRTKELKDAYLYICNAKGKAPKESLANLPIPNVRGPYYKLVGHHYSIGVAAMFIAYEKNGLKSYRDVIKNNFEFLRTNGETSK